MGGVHLFTKKNTSGDPIRAIRFAICAFRKNTKCERGWTITALANLKSKRFKYNNVYDSTYTEIRAHHLYVNLTEDTIAKRLYPVILTQIQYEEYNRKRNLLYDEFHEKKFGDEYGNKYKDDYQKALLELKLTTSLDEQQLLEVKNISDYFFKIHVFITSFMSKEKVLRDNFEETSPYKLFYIPSAFNSAFYVITCLKSFDSNKIFDINNCNGDVDAAYEYKKDTPSHFTTN